MDKPVIAGIGEVLFDIIGDVEKLGGAPVNFSYHVQNLGAQGYAVSTVGDDRRGTRVIAELQQKGISTDCIAVVDGYQTGFVQASLDADGVASYEFPEDIAWDHLTLNTSAIDLAPRLDGVCFGSLVQRGRRSREALYHFLDLVPDGAVKIFDINLRQEFYSREVIVKSLDYADILKLNDDELQILAEMLDLQGDTPEMLVNLVAMYDLQLVAMTRGGRGSVLVTPDAYDDHPGIQTERVVDTIGAGDAFTAAVAISLIKGYDLQTVNERSNRVAAWVCGERGAMPELPASLKM